MNRRQWLHLAAVLALSLLARAVLFNYVGIWGDAGFYIYDARLINNGLTPYVDFVGRSPLFNYAYAYTAALLGNSMVTLRSFIALWWILCLFPVYYIAEQIHGHRAGVAAGAVMQLTPFMIIYGYWANTQSLAALLVISGLAGLVWRDGDPVGFGIAGIAIGAAFLSRRSMITIPGAVGLYTLYLAYDDRDIRLLVARGGAAIGAFCLPLAVGYLMLANWRVEMAFAFAETHGWGLIASSGRGGFPLLTDAEPPAVENQIKRGRIPIFNDFCQMCGSWTARTFAKTTLVTTPAIGPLLWYFRDWTDRWFSDRLRDYTFGILLLLGGYAIVKAMLAGFYMRPFVALTLIGFGLLAFRTPAVSRRILYHRYMVLMLLCLTGLATGYLYRNRVLHTYYFSDFFPFLSVVVGVVAVAIWEAMADE